jgi:hypothetical protein
MFTRIKVIGGKNYYYLVENQRIDGKVRQRVMRYLGTSKPSPKVIADVVAAVKHDSSLISTDDKGVSSIK